MAPSSRMNLASLLQSDPPEEPRRPPPAPSLPPLPPPSAYPPTDSAPAPAYSSQSSSHGQPLPPSSYTPAPPAPSSSNYPGSSSQYSHTYSSHGQPPPPASQLPPVQSGGHAYLQSSQSHSYTPSPTHTGPPAPPPPSSSQPHHHSHQYHQHSHQHAHHHVNSHPHHLSSHVHHPHSHHHHAHAHPHAHHHHPSHSHVHVIHNHPTPPASQPPPPSSSSAAGSPPGFASASHAFSAGPPPTGRGPQPIIPVNSTPAPRSPVHYTGASRSPSAAYSIYGAGAALASGRRTPDFSTSSQPPMGAPSSSSGARRNTLTGGSSGPQAIEPVTLRDYPPYPGTGPPKHPDDPYPPAFSAPVYGSRPQSPQTQSGNKLRRSGGGGGSISSRSTGVKRSIGGASELKRSVNERSRERDEHEMDKEREELVLRERDRERDRDRERERDLDRSREHREYDEQARAMRDRERERDRLPPHDMDMRDGRRPPTSKRPVGLESEFARRPASSSEWDRPRERDHRDRDRRGPRDERDWRREEEEARQGVPQLVQSKHLPPISAHGGYPEKQPHMHSHSLSIPPLQQARPPAHSHAHHYSHPLSHPRAVSPHPHSTLPPLLSPVWLGTFVYPNLPFPVRLPPSLSRNNLTSEGYRPYQYTVLVPSGFLPHQPPSRSQRPDIPLWGSPQTGYTDDSNLLLAALHSGSVSWSDIRRARQLKQDAKIVVGVWVGGANGGRNAVRPKGGMWEGTEGNGQLRSCGWGNTHDGGGMEIVEIVWTEPGSAHAPHRPNRRDRMEQYAKRRADLELVPPVKRDRIDTWFLDSDEEEAAIPTKRTWDVGETIVFGKSGSGFVYDPHTLRSVVFEESNERSTKRFKSKEKDTSKPPKRDIILENDDEHYILALKPADGQDKNKDLKYTLSTFSPKSKKTEVLRNSLTEEDVSFLDKGLCVWLKDSVEPKQASDLAKEKMDTGSDEGAQPEENADGDRKGWFCHVSRWKFAADDLKDGVQN
ncbi:hypothetical protein RhiJN_02087 [Ceratobasidium sp. AG-Ba]|nr:hypothetical protein RhiJN_02087 [Ceratobasidium sp. AG-Ba]